jgi:hypothetical protein
LFDLLLFVTITIDIILPADNIMAGNYANLTRSVIFVECRGRRWLLFRLVVWLVGKICHALVDHLQQLKLARDKTNVGPTGQY